MTPDAPPFRPTFLPARASSRRAMEAHEREPVTLVGSSARDRTLTPRPGKSAPLTGPAPPPLHTMGVVSPMAVPSSGTAPAMAT
eukprot:8851834-Prorocentrum_lima.AAC.1